jgi:hypothetical protein
LNSTAWRKPLVIISEYEKIWQTARANNRLLRLKAKNRRNNHKRELQGKQEDY